MVGWYPVGKYPSFPPAFAKMSTPLVESLPLWPKGASGVIPPLPSPEMLDKDMQRHQRCVAQAAGAGWHWVVAVQIVSSIFTLGGLIFVFASLPAARLHGERAQVRRDLRGEDVLA